jgi:hypothetical protein
VQLESDSGRPLDFVGASSNPRDSPTK